MANTEKNTAPIVDTTSTQTAPAAVNAEKKVGGVTRAKKSNAQTDTQKKETTTATNALDTAKKVKDNAADIGTAAAVRVKFDAIVAARDAIAVCGDTAEGRKVYRLVLSAAAAAHRAAVSDAAMKGAGISEDTRKEYLFKVATIYRAAINYADKYNGGDDKAKKATRSALFTEWKNLLTFLSGDAVKASADDAVNLMNAATRTIKGGLEYEAYDKQDGTKGARMVKGVAATASVSPVSFQKELERYAVDRLLGFDGIMSYNAVKATTTKNGELRADTIKAAETGVSLEKSPSNTAA